MTYTVSSGTLNLTQQAIELRVLLHHQLVIAH